MSDKNQEQIYIFDTTLRDAEQSPGCALNSEEKLQIARQLEKLGVDVIEAGFPISSPGDMEAVQMISQEVRKPEICALSRALEKDITAAWDGIKDAAKPRIHTFVGTSDIHIRGILQKKGAISQARNEVLQMAVDAVKQARSLCETVEFSPMDATRTDWGYLCEVISASVDAGADIINIPDTVGYAMPSEFGKLIQCIAANVPSDVIVSVHCHNDLGMAVSNSLEAVANGARQIECTINGLGERAGNAGLEEIVMALRTRPDYFEGLDTSINIQELYPTSQLVSRLMGMPVPPNKAIVGANAFAHSSGIHQDGILKERTTFEIMNPSDVGVPETTLPLSPRSGRKALAERLKELGYEPSDEQLNRVYKRFLFLADQKKQVLEADLEALAQDELPSVPKTFGLLRFECKIGSFQEARGYVAITTKEEPRAAQSYGNGPVNAIYKAIAKATGIELVLEDYKISAVTPGTDAIGTVTIKASCNGFKVTGHGASIDVIEASARAYINAVNKLVHSREKIDPDKKPDWRKKYANH